MTTASSPTLNTYFTCNPAQIAENKYSEQTWNERYAYITMVAFTVLAAVGHFYLYPIVLPMTLLVYDVSILSIATSVILPLALDLFAQAKKLQAQGDRETQIQTKLTELHAMDEPTFNAELASRRLLPEASLNAQAVKTLLARIMYWEKHAEDMAAAANQLHEENKFREALEARTKMNQDRTKAGFYYALFSNSAHQGKFKKTFAWADLTLEERAIRHICEHDSYTNVAETREATPRLITSEHMRIHRNLPRFGQEFMAPLLIPAPITTGS